MKLQLIHWLKTPENMYDLKESEPKIGWNYYTLRLFCEVRIDENQWDSYGLKMDDENWTLTTEYVKELLHDYKYD